MLAPGTEIRRHRASEPWTYARLDARQREIASELASGGAGRLLLSELSSVITTGRRTPASDLLATSPELARAGIELLAVERGGLATYHGPGQWVVFPVDRLERLTGDSRGVRKAVEALLAAALDVAREEGVLAEIRRGPELGVWGPRGKLASVGVHVSHGILLHGMALNVFQTPESFQGLRPCGCEPRIDYLNRSGDPEAAFQRVGTRIAQAVLKRLWVDSVPANDYIQEVQAHF